MSDNNLHPRWAELRNAHPKVPVHLRSWLSEQRRKWKAGALSSHEEHILQKLGHRKPRSYNKLSWMEMYERLADFQRDTGRMYPVRRKAGDDQPLARWVMTQRERADELTAKQESLLEGLPEGWVWNADWHKFEKMYQRLIRFHKKHGHFEVPNKGKYKDLHWWVRDIRRRVQRNKKSAVYARYRVELAKINYKI